MSNLTLNAVPWSQPGTPALPPGCFPLATLPNTYWVPWANMGMSPETAMDLYYNLGQVRVAGRLSLANCTDTLSVSSSYFQAYEPSAWWPEGGTPAPYPAVLDTWTTSASGDFDPAPGVGQRTLAGPVLDFDILMNPATNTGYTLTDGLARIDPRRAPWGYATWPTNWHGTSNGVRCYLRAERMKWFKSADSGLIMPAWTLRVQLESGTWPDQLTAGSWPRTSVTRRKAYWVIDSWQTVAGSLGTEHYGDLCWAPGHYAFSHWGDVTYYVIQSYWRSSQCIMGGDSSTSSYAAANVPINWHGIQQPFLVTSQARYLATAHAATPILNINLYPA